MLSGEAGRAVKPEGRPGRGLP